MVKRLVPAADEWEWQQQGACRDEDNSKFFEVDGESKADKRLRIVQAKEICAVCPVLGDCREWALATRQTHGIWGGMTPKERTFELKRRAELLAGGAALVGADQPSSVTAEPPVTAESVADGMAADVATEQAVETMS